MYPQMKKPVGMLLANQNLKLLYEVLTQKNQKTSLALLVSLLHSYCKRQKDINQKNYLISIGHKHLKKLMIFMRDQNEFVGFGFRVYGV